MSFEIKIRDYIDQKRRDKIEKLDKDRKKEAIDVDLYAQKIASLEESHTVGNWLSDASQRAKQICFATHVVKYSHSDAKSSSFMVSPAKDLDSSWLCTASIRSYEPDIFGNAAALDVGNLLRISYEGQTVADQILSGSKDIFKAFSTDDGTINTWIDGFRHALSPKTPHTNYLSKQVFFPVEGSYHVVAPLFPSSLAHALYERIQRHRYSEESKATREAKKKKQYSTGTDVNFLGLHVQKFGGSQPQNVSLLNSQRRGRIWLLQAEPPVWTKQKKPPHHLVSIFSRYSPPARSAKSIISDLKEFLLSAQKKNLETRDKRDKYIDSIMECFTEYAVELQCHQDFYGWTSHGDCNLKSDQRLWLDPYNKDLNHLAMRKEDVWMQSIAKDFGIWLNAMLRVPGKLELGAEESGEWSKRFLRVIKEAERFLPLPFDE